MGFLKGIGSSMEKLEGWFLAQSLCLSSCLHASRMHRLIADITSNQPLGYTLVKEDTASPSLSSLSDVCDQRIPHSLRTRPDASGHDVCVPQDLPVCAPPCCHGGRGTEEKVRV